MDPYAVVIRIDRDPESPTDVEDEIDQLFPFSYNHPYAFVTNSHVASTTLRERLDNDLQNGVLSNDDISQIKKELIALIQKVHSIIIDPEISILMKNNLRRQLQIHRDKFVSLVGKPHNTMQTINTVWQNLVNIVRHPYMTVILGLASMIITLIGIIVYNQSPDDENLDVKRIFGFAVSISDSLCILSALGPMWRCMMSETHFLCFNFPPHLNLLQGIRLVNNLENISLQPEYRTKNIFKKNPQLFPRNIQEIALKLWSQYSADNQLLSQENLTSVLSEYAQYLKIRGKLFEIAVKENFVNTLLNTPVISSTQKLRDLIVSTEQASAETIVSQALDFVKNSLDLSHARKISYPPQIRVLGAMRFFDPAINDQIDSDTRANNFGAR